MTPQNAPKLLSDNPNPQKGSWFKDTARAVLLWAEADSQSSLHLESVGTCLNDSLCSLYHTNHPFSLFPTCRRSLEDQRGAERNNDSAFNWFGGPISALHDVRLFNDFRLGMRRGVFTKRGRRDIAFFIYRSRVITSAKTTKVVTFQK